MKQFIVEQKITPLVNRYVVYEGSSEQTNRSLIAFVEQKRFSFKEEIAFYTDEAKTTLAFRVRAEKVMDIHGKFNITDGDGNQISAVRKNFKASLTRSTWEVLNNDDTLLLTVKERSLGLAIFRRIWGLLPYIGDLPFIFKYHFTFTNADDKEVASYIKTKRFRDHYQLQIEDDQDLETIGWQTFIAQCVLLDALQGR